MVGLPLADVPLDTIAPATMHIILGLTKKIYEYLLELFRRLEEMEEEKTEGHVTYQFRQGIAEAKDNAQKYVEFLNAEFNDDIQTVEKKRAETKNILKEIENIRSRISTVRFGKQRDKLIQNLTILEGELEK